MEPIGATVEHALSLGGQIGEVRWEHRRCYFRRHTHFSVSDPTIVLRLPRTLTETWRLSDCGVGGGTWLEKRRRFRRQMIFDLLNGPCAWLPNFALPIIRYFNQMMTCSPIRAINKWETSLCRSYKFLFLFFFCTDPKKKIT